MRKSLQLLALPFWLMAGCATTPGEIDKTPTLPVSVEQVQQQPTAHVGKTVRWGGTVLNVVNKKEATYIEILSRPLSKTSRPLDKPGSGRFMVEIAEFVDPAKYPAGRDLTVVGTVNRVEQKAIGEYPYQYPVLSGVALHLWPERVDKEPYYPYPYYDPFWGPPYPHWPYYSPFWRHHPYYW